MDFFKRHWRAIAAGSASAGILVWVLSLYLKKAPKRRVSFGCVIDEDTTRNFIAAVAAINGGQVVVPSDDTLLKLYGLYKQATVGVADESKAANFWDLVGRSKYEAWAKLGSMDQAAAMKHYAELVDALPSAGQGGAQRKEKSWKTSSRPLAPEVDNEKLAKKEPDFLTYSSEGNVSQVLRLLRLEPEKCLSMRNEDGVTGLLWACDRGHEELVEELLNAGADIETRDGSGMRPLHYAVMCGHVGVVKMLLARGADTAAADLDGCTPVQVADSPEILTLLQG